jgi:hypothetical protein
VDRVIESELAVNLAQVFPKPAPPLGAKHANAGSAGFEMSDELSIEFQPITSEYGFEQVPCCPQLAADTALHRMQAMMVENLVIQSPFRF